MTNVVKFKQYMIFLFVCMQIMSLLYMRLYWGYFGIDVLDYVTFYDIVFSPIGFLQAFLFILLFFYLSYNEPPIPLNRFFSFRSDEFFGFVLLVTFFSFLWSKIPFFYDYHGFLEIVCFVSLLVLPSYFANTTLAERYFSGGAEAYLYSATLFLGLAFLYLTPDIQADAKLKAVSDNNDSIPVVEIFDCTECKYNMVGKIGGFFVVYDLNLNEVLAVSERSVKQVRYK